VEVGETHELRLVNSEVGLHEEVTTWLTELMAGEDFIFGLKDHAYTFTWDFPHMTHKIVNGFHETWGDGQDKLIAYPRLTGSTRWRVFTVRRTS
jgi:hypothetical protein